MVGKLWWGGFGFRPRDLEQLIRGRRWKAVAVDPLWTYVHSSRSASALNLSTGGLYVRVAMRATGLQTAVYTSHRSLDSGLKKDTLFKSAAYVSPADHPRRRLGVPV